MAARQLIPTAWKARVAALGLAGLLAWPPLHFGLVERYRLDPWRFFGFAMYCRPTLPVRVEARVLGEDGPVEVDPRRLPRGAQAAWGSFVRARSVLGDLRTPEALGAILLGPDVREVVFVVTHARLEPGSGRIVAEAVEYRYRGRTSPFAEPGAARERPPAPVDAEGRGSRLRSGEVRTPRPGSGRSSSSRRSVRCRTP